MADKFFYGYIFLVGTLLAVNYLFCKNNVNIVIVLMVGLIFTALFCFAMKKIKVDFAYRFMLGLQCVIPLMLFVYLKDIYKYGEETIVIENNLRTKAFWWCIIIVLVIQAVVHAVKKWNAEAAKIEDIVAWSSCVSFAGISTFSSFARLVNDSHHLGENVISFNQVFRHHLIPYVDYFPVSGAFPVTLGGIQELLGLDLTGTLMAQAVFSFIVMMLIVWLGCRYINRKYMMLIGILMPFSTAYMRPNLMLVYLLILFLPSLRNKRGYWLETWVALTFMTVFFYPLYGVATLAGVLPLGIYQSVMFFRKGEHKQYFKKTPFLLIFVVELVVILISIPVIFGVIRHTLIYSDSSMLSNAWPTFGQGVPDGFFSWLTQYAGIRICLWYVIRYMLPILVVWVLCVLVLRFIKGNHILDVLRDSEGFHLSFSAMIALVISCTYTTQRLDEYSLLARTTHVLFPTVGILFCILFFKYIKRNAASMFFMGIICALCYIGSSNFLTNVEGVFDKNQSISTDFAYVSQEEAEEYENLGEGFIPIYMKDSLKVHKQNSQELLMYDSDLSFIGIELGYLTALDIKTAGQPSIYAIMTYKQTAMAIKSIKETKPVIFTEDINPVGNYYLYKWLLNSKQYVYSAKYSAFLPLELADKIGLSEDNRLNSVWTCTDVGNTSASAGKSIQTLQGNYEPVTVALLVDEFGAFSTTDEETGVVTHLSSVNVTFDQSVAGTEGDYLYIELSRSYGNKSNLTDIEDKIERNITKEKINDGCVASISWTGEADRNNYINCLMSDGRLLIPLGTNINWLLSEHDGFTVTVSGLDEGEIVNVVECRLMKSKDL